MPAPFISIPRSSPVSGRARDYLGEVNRVVADPDLGASLEQIEEGMKNRQARLRIPDDDESEEDDLVGRLIYDNRDLWDKLVNNRFCADMKEAPASDEEVLKGFKWYMRQDFLYSVKVMAYGAESIKAQNSMEFGAWTQRVKENADYSRDILATCTTRPPYGLGIKDLDVLQTEATLALLWYTQFQLLVAKKTDWVISMVPFIPCIQSYFLIARDLVKNSVDKDSIWYKLWVVENAKYEGSAILQRQFFIGNYDEWSEQYDKANEVFQLACNGEINLWATAMNPDSL